MEWEFLVGTFTGLIEEAFSVNIFRGRSEIDYLRSSRRGEIRFLKKEAFL